MYPSINPERRPPLGSKSEPQLPLRSATALVFLLLAACTTARPLPQDGSRPDVALPTAGRSPSVGPDAAAPDAPVDVARDVAVDVPPRDVAVDPPPRDTPPDSGCNVCYGMCNAGRCHAVWDLSAWDQAEWAP
jgi:hypothetical protein